MRILTTTLVTAALTLGAASASAAYVSFLDQTAGTYGPGMDSWTSTQDGATVEVTNQPTYGTRLDWSAEDGFGIRENTWTGVEGSYEQDEIEGAKESLTAEFTSGEVYVTGIDLTDFFFEERNGQQYSETGTISFYDAVGTLLGAIDVVAPDHFVANGEYTVDVLSELGDVLTSSVVFTAPGQVGTQDHEYAVAGITFDTVARSVPELDARGSLAALGLLLGGLFMVASRRRRDGFITA